MQMRPQQHQQRQMAPNPRQMAPQQRPHMMNPQNQSNPYTMAAYGGKGPQGYGGYNQYPTSMAPTMQQQQQYHYQPQQMRPQQMQPIPQPQQSPGKVPFNLKA